jgi:nucleotide-binding universal stress UspA family protein
MAHRPRAALASYLMGSVTSGVVHHCATPVVVLHLANAADGCGDEDEAEEQA